MGIRGGIDLGGTKIQAVVVDDGGEVLGSSRLPTPTTGGPPDVAETMAEAIRDAAEQADADTGDLEGVGVGSPGAVADDEGTVAAARNLPDWEEAYPLRDDLSCRLDTRVRLGNDVQVATDAEFELGAGAALRLDPRACSGAPAWAAASCSTASRGSGRSAAGEIGHVVVNMGGRKCPCGRRGCMEAYAGRLALERRARELVDEGPAHQPLRDHGGAGTRPAHERRVGAGAEGRGRVARKLIHAGREGAGRRGGVGVNVLDVEAVVIGGGMGVRLGDPYVRRIREAMMPHLFVDYAAAGGRGWPRSETSAGRSEPRCSWSGPARTNTYTRSMSEVAGVVLAGGRSTRMGRPKANLEWHGSTLLHRVTGIVGRAVEGPVVVVRAPDQELPELPPGVRVVEDAAEGRGPLQGLAAGLGGGRRRRRASRTSPRPTCRCSIPRS